MSTTFSLPEAFIFIIIFLWSFPRACVHFFCFFAIFSFHVRFIFSLEFLVSKEQSLSPVKYRVFYAVFIFTFGHYEFSLNVIQALEAGFILGFYIYFLFVWFCKMCCSSKNLNIVSDSPVLIGPFFSFRFLLILFFVVASFSCGANYKYVCYVTFITFVLDLFYFLSCETSSPVIILSLECFLYKILVLSPTSEQHNFLVA